MNAYTEFAKQVIELSKEAGALTPAAIFAITTLYFAWCKHALERANAVRNEAWQKIRIADAVAQARQSEDLQEVVITLQRVVEKVNENNTIIKERLPGRS